MVISLTHFFDVVSRRHNDVILLLAMRKMSSNDFVPAGQCTDIPRRARATVELLRQETPNFLLFNLWSPNDPDLSCLWITRSGLSCSIVSTTDKVKLGLIDVWCGLEQYF